MAETSAFRLPDRRMAQAGLMAAFNPVDGKDAITAWPSVYDTWLRQATRGLRDSLLQVTGARLDPLRLSYGANASVLYHSRRSALNAQL